MFDVLVVDQSSDTNEDELPVQAFPPIEVLKSTRARPITKRKAQGPSKADKELNKMVKELEATPWAVLDAKLPEVIHHQPTAEPAANDKPAQMRRVYM